MNKYIIKFASQKDLCDMYYKLKSVGILTLRMLSQNALIVKTKVTDDKLVQILDLQELESTFTVNKFEWSLK